MKHFAILPPKLHIELGCASDGLSKSKVRILFRRGFKGSLVYRVEFTIGSLMMDDFTDWFYHLKEKYSRRLYGQHNARDYSLTFLTELKMYHDLKGFKMYTSESKEGTTVYRKRSRRFNSRKSYFNKKGLRNVCSVS